MTWTTRPRSEATAGLAWLRAGSGEPMVLLHGVGLRAETWGAQLDALNGRFSLYALDMPGHGESAPFEAEPCLADYSDRIAHAIESIGVPVLLTGHSMGAMIALDIAIRHPRLCRGVAVLNAIYRRSPAAVAAVRERDAALPGVYATDPSLTLARWFGESLDRAEAKACRRWLEAVDPIGYKQAYSVFAANDGPDSQTLAGLACPALFITGSAEPNSTPQMSHAMAEIAPRGQALVVDGAAHMMPMSHATWVNTALLELGDRCRELRA